MLICGIVGCRMLAFGMLACWGEIGLDYEGLQVLKRDEHGR